MTFPTRPVVITQTASHRGGQAVSERLRNGYRSGFLARLQEEEANDGRHITEDVHWIAVEPGTHAALEAGRVSGVGDGGAVVSFALWHSQQPVVLGAVETFNGGDTVALRMPAIDGLFAEFAVEEEQSADLERATRAKTWVRDPRPGRNPMTRWHVPRRRVG